MKHRRVPLTSLAALVVLLLTASPARAQESNVVETFDGPLGAGWEAAPEVSVSNGLLVVPPGAFAFRGGSWSRITLTGLSYEGDGELLIDYALGDGGQYTLHLIGDRVWMLEKAGIELAAESGAVVEPATPIELTIEIGLSASTVAVDGETVLSAPDAAPLGAGGLSMHAGGDRTLTLDRMTLVGLDEAAPAAAEAAVSSTTADEPAPPPSTSADAAGWLKDFFAINTLGSGIGQAAINLSLAAVLAFILGRVYVYWGAGLSNRRRFAANFMVVAVATTFIIVVVRSSVALSLGLVGALSIVRFRAAIKDPEELTYMFLAIGIGIGLGDNQRLLTIVALGIAVAVVGLMRLFRESTADFNLHVTVSSEGPSAVEPDAIAATLHPHCTRIRLSRFDETPTTSECSYLVEFAGSKELHAARRALRELSPDLSVSFLDDKGLW